MTVQIGEVSVAGLDDDWPRVHIEAELVTMLSRRLSELGFLRAEVAPFDQVLGKLMRGPGKRLRPAFVYWGYRAAGGAATGPEADSAVQVGCAMEFLHACALICDDLMDDSAMRRWQPAAHVQLADDHAEHHWRGDPGHFGRAAALLLGLQAFTWADAAICDAGLPPGRLAEVLRVFTTLRAEVIGGQYLDLVNAHRGDTGDDMAQRVAIYKSAKYTVERPLHLGAAVAGGGSDSDSFLSAYGLPLGEAFQLRDDVLGVFGNPAVTGKPADGDIREGKQTMLLIRGRKLAAAAQRRMIDRVAGNPEATRDDIAGVRQVLADCGALDAVEDRITSLTRLAQAAVVARDGLPADVQAALLNLAARATRRGC